jgi:cholesterol oxidase
VAVTGPAADSGVHPAVGPDVDHDVVVVGSGFGGSVAALRLAEKGYDVLVLEAGRRFADDDFARTSWDLRRFLWAPALGCFGVQRIHRLRDVVVLAGAGVGGGSLNYANTLYVPPTPFFTDPQWGGITDWQAELAPYYDQAARMLGVVVNPCEGPVEQVMRQVADDLGVGHSFRKTPVGVFFGRDGEREPGVEVPDPFFGGAGPARTGCVECGNCMVGCRYGAKNTLVKNYLALAERLGVRVEPLRTVVGVQPRDARDPGKGWLVTTVRTGARGGRRDVRTVSARQVVVAAGAWGTAALLQSLRADAVLPRLSPRLGSMTRTNSEALLGAVTTRVPADDLTRGVAITSSFHPDDDTHVENVRYGRGSNAMGLLGTVLVDGNPDQSRGRWRRLWRVVAGDPAAFVRSFSARRWSQRSVIGLVMQSVDNSITVSAAPRRLGPVRLRGWRLDSRPGYGAPNPRWVPAGHDAVRRIASRLAERTGVPAAAGGAIGDLADVPMTAHFLGGCPIGAEASSGVLDAYHRVFGYEGLHVVDGSAISANLGVNPSLTITAQAERAFALWPNKGDADPRPPLGAGYRRIAPVAPRRPAVPADAPGALRLTAVAPPVVRQGAAAPRPRPDVDAARRLPTTE